MTALLDLTSMNNALQRFSEALQAYNSDIKNTLYRDACIQRFEFSYELSHKMLKRFLELTSANPAEIDQLAFPNLIRTGNEQGLLLNDWNRWKEYRHARNISSHTYEESKAIQVMEVLPDFLLEAQALLQELQKRNNLQA